MPFPSARTVVFRFAGGSLPRVLYQRDGLTDSDPSAHFLRVSNLVADTVLGSCERCGRMDELPTS